MQVKEAIKQLQKLNPESHIVFAYWSQDMFPEIAPEKWPAAAELIEEEFDWSNTHTAMGDLTYMLRSKEARPTEKDYQRLERGMYRILRDIKKCGIDDDYRVMNAEENDKPGISVTIGVSWKPEGKFTFGFQTGDNSYAGGAYSHPHWAVIDLYRTSNCKELAKDAVDQIAELIG